jgi:hypothetical protein
MANNLKAFLDYLEEQVRNHSIYVWGAQGQQGTSITEKWIKRRETSDTNYNRAVAFWKKQCAAGYGDVLRAFDCSGLGMYWLQNVTHILKYDCNANTLYGKCKKISKGDVRVGDFVFHINSTTKRATHIGYVVDTDKNVIEALGRDAGVVKRKFSKGKWTGFGRPPFWTEDEVHEITGQPQEPMDPDTFVFKRVLKYGCVGDDVCELKILLRGAGFDNLTIGNRNYYSKTKKTVKAFQKAHGLKADGKAGPETIAALDGKFQS